MMKHTFFLSLFITIFGFGSQMAFGQRPCTAPTVTFTPTVTHATCFNPKGSISFTTTIGAGGSGYMQSLILRNAIGGTVYNHFPSQSLSGTISNLDVGMYTITGTVAVEYFCNGLGYMTTVNVSATLWVGFQTVWKDLIEMTAFPNSYSARKHITSATMAGVGSLNGIDAGDYWIDMKAQFGSANNTSVFWLIGENDAAASFSAASNVQYIEFFKTTGTSGGIRIKRRLANGTFTIYTLPSALYTDKITLIRTGTTLSLRRNNVLLIPPLNDPFFPVASTGAVNIVVRTSALNNGCLDVVSSLGCNYENHYHYLKPSIEETIAYVSGDLKFKFEDNFFDATQTLEYQIEDLTTMGASVLSGNLTKTQKTDFYSIEIGSAGLNLVSGRTYLLSVTDEKGLKSYLKFKKA